MSRANSGNVPEQQNVAQQLKDKATEAVSSAREAVGEQYDNLKQQATEYYQSGREKAMEWEQQLEDYVREQPVKSLLMAAGVGIVLGMIWKRV